MEQKPEIVALVPLRGGSKSIPDKNIKNIAGKPLCMWVLGEAVLAKRIDKVYVSTDSKKIKDVIISSSLDVEILDRDPSLATDKASTESVMLDFAGRVDFDILVTIQATSPLTEAVDIDSALDMFEEKRLNSLVTGTRSKRFFWTDDGKPVNYNPCMRPIRQDFKGYIMENGAFYITKRDILEKYRCRVGGKIGIFQMSPETSVELDEYSDWMAMENLLLERKKRNFGKLARNIKLLLMDVDGVLTDAFVYCDQNGMEMKRFSVRDGMGLSMIHDMGIKTGIITKENTDIADYRAKKLKIDYIYKGIEDKTKSLEEISKKSGIAFENIAYIGDDIIDIEILKAVGFSAIPNDAESSLKNIADYICKSDGGKGCVREICNMIIANHTL
jgi:YrbI family 3-deoxy-D-manno-octulosonate 8-phosphate phosphatase